MSKWTVIRTDRNTTKTDVKMMQKQNKILRNTIKLSLDELKKQGDEAFKARLAEEDKLILAVQEGRVTKQEQKNKAAAILKARNKSKKEDAKDGSSN